jgi:hypothetical protein
MDSNIKSRKVVYKYFMNKVKHNLNMNLKQQLVKSEVLGRGWQGKVYRACDDNYCLAIKKIYLDKKESKYINDIYNKKALKSGTYIEYATGKLLNQLVLQGICPHFVLNYTQSIKDRTDDICDNLYPYNMLHYNELIDDGILFYDWMQKYHGIAYYYNIYFQIMMALYSIQKYFNLTHLDLHSGNIIIKNVKKGGYWKYILNDKVYYLPNLGYQIYIIDFGHAYIPKVFESATVKYRFKQLKNKMLYDINYIFKETITDNTNVSEYFISKFKTEIIKKLKCNKGCDSTVFADIIENIWLSKYSKLPNNSEKDKIKMIDTFNLDKNLNTKDIPDELIELLGL